MRHPNTPGTDGRPPTSVPALQYATSRPSWFSSCLEILLPTACLVCCRPVRHTLVCYRCRPPLPDLTDTTTRSCKRCFSPLGAGKLCDSCETCSLFPPLTDSMRFLWEYDGLARDLIRAIKYRPSISLATMAGQLLRDAAGHLFDRSDWDMIIPVPSSHAMFRRRLFHPCVELARPLARARDIPLVQGLHHNSRRAPQASLSHHDRLLRLSKLFTLTKRCSPRGQRILLIEDVITTGATISAAAALLQRSGATRIDVLALARTRVWSRFRRRLHDEASLIQF
jgi:ComF family protein